MFLFRLCRELGYPHPDYLRKVLTSSQITEWQAYDRIDPIGKWRDEYIIAVLASVIMNIAKSVWGKKNVKPSSPKDFMPNWEKAFDKPKPQSVEEMKQILFALAGVKENG